MQSHSSRHDLRRWLLPSVTQWLWLMLFLLLIAQPWRTWMVASDGDACMHWRVGEWMLQHQQIIRADEFSHTRPGAPIVSKEWLAEILFALAGRLGGLFGLAALAALLIATTFALLHRQLLREGGDLLVSTVVVLLAAWAASSHWMARPHAFSFLTVLLWNVALRNFSRSGEAKPLLHWLGGLTLLWVNLHGGYLAGFLILGAYGLGAGIEFVRAVDGSARIAAKRRLVILSTAGLLCFAISLINPNGYQLHLHNIQFLQSDFLRDWLAEYRSTDFFKPDARGFLVWLAVLFVMMAVARPRVSAADGILLISWTYFGLYAARNIPLLTIITAPIVGAAFSTFLREKWPSRLQHAAALNASLNGWPPVATIAVAIVLFVPHPTEMIPSKWPVHAVAYIKQHPEKFTGKMINHYVWGGYLLHELPDHPVFVDGRTDFYGETLIRQFDDVAILQTNWLQVIKQYDVGWSLLPTGHRLNLAFDLLPNWTCEYSNDVAAVFLKHP